jgi:hypothetical protein
LLQSRKLNLLLQIHHETPPPVQAKTTKAVGI